MPQGLTVSQPSKDAEIVVVRYQNSDPQLAWQVPNTLGRRFIERRQETQKTEARSTVAFLRQQIDTLNVNRQLAALRGDPPAVPRTGARNRSTGRGHGAGDPFHHFTGRRTHSKPNGERWLVSSLRCATLAARDRDPAVRRPTGASSHFRPCCVATRGLPRFPHTPRRIACRTDVARSSSSSPPRCCSGLGLAEAGLRLFAPVVVDPPTGDPLAHRWEYRQNLPGLRPVIVYQQNEYGLRSRAIGSEPKKPGDVRVVCLGASTTDQPTQNLEDTWCDLLGVALNRDYAAPGVRYQTGSFGRGGYRAVDDLAWAEDSLAALQPDLVVLLLGINDLVWNGGPDYRYVGLDSALAGSRIRRGPASTPRTDTLPSLPRRLCSARLQLCRRAILLKRRLAGEQPLEWHSATLPSLRQAYRALPSVRAVGAIRTPWSSFGTLWIRWSECCRREASIYSCSDSLCSGRQDGARRAGGTLVQRGHAGRQGPTGRRVARARDGAVQRGAGSRRARAGRAVWT